MGLPSTSDKWCQKYWDNLCRKNVPDWCRGREIINNNDGKHPYINDNDGKQPYSYVNSGIKPQRRVKSDKT
jgi:hypothetical protein